jgi:Fe-S cluster assembly protein SufD
VNFSNALLLSETAEFDAKPELEIYADDVVCGHGATCGDLNHDHLFYMMSRGIPELEARAMLVHAFVAEAIGMVEHEAVRDVLMGLVQERMR